MPEGIFLNGRGPWHVYPQRRGFIQATEIKSRATSHCKRTQQHEVGFVSIHYRVRCHALRLYTINQNLPLPLYSSIRTAAMVERSSDFQDTGSSILDADYTRYPSPGQGKRQPRRAWKNHVGFWQVLGSVRHSMTSSHFALIQPIQIMQFRHVVLEKANAPHVTFDGCFFF